MLSPSVLRAGMFVVCVALSACAGPSVLTPNDVRVLVPRRVWMGEPFSETRLRDAKRELAVVSGHHLTLEFKPARSLYRGSEEDVVATVEACARDLARLKDDSPRVFVHSMPRLTHIV